MMELTYQMFLEQVIDQRERGVIPNDRIVDSHFLDLMADPVATLRRLYDESGMTWPAGHEQTVREYLAAKPKGKHGAHRYEFADVGLDEASVRTTFARYVDVLRDHRRAVTGAGVTRAGAGPTRARSRTTRGRRRERAPARTTGTPSSRAPVGT